MNIAVDTDARAVTRPRARLGELLIETRALCESDVARVVAAQRDRADRFGAIALEMKLVTKEQLRDALAQQVNYPFVTAAGSTLSPLLVTAHDPFGEYAEAMRTLRSQLLLRWFGTE